LWPVGLVSHELGVERQVGRYFEFPDNGSQSLSCSNNFHDKLDIGFDGLARSYFVRPRPQGAPTPTVLPGNPAASKYFVAPTLCSSRTVDRPSDPAGARTVLLVATGILPPR